MVVVYRDVARRGDGERQPAMTRHAREQMIEKWNTGRDRAIPSKRASVQIEAHEDIRLAGDTAPLGAAYRRAFAVIN